MVEVEGRKEGGERWGWGSSMNREKEIAMVWQINTNKAGARQGERERGGGGGFNGGQPNERGASKEGKGIMSGGAIGFVGGRREGEDIPVFN
jgi:hypothetical protein